MASFGRSTTNAKGGMFGMSGASRGMSGVALARVSPGQAIAMRNAERFAQRMGRRPAPVSSTNNSALKGPAPQAPQRQPAPVAAKQDVQPPAPKAPEANIQQQVALSETPKPAVTLQPVAQMMPMAPSPGRGRGRLRDMDIGGTPQAIDRNTGKTISAQDHRDDNNPKVKNENAPMDDHMAAVQATSVAGLEMAAAAMRGGATDAPKPAGSGAKPQLTHGQVGVKPPFAGIQAPSPFGH